MKFNQIAKRSIIFLPLFLPFFVLRFSLAGIPSTLLEVAIWIVFVANLAASNIKIKWSWQLLFALLVLVFAFVGALVDPSLTSGFGLFKAYFLDGFLVYLLVLGSSSKEKSDFAKLLIISAVVASIESIILYLMGIKSSDGRIVDLSRLSSNYLAMYLAPIAVLALSKLRRKLDRRNILLILSLLVMSLAMYLTDSRGIIVAIVPAIIYLVYSLQKTKNWFIKTSFAMIAILFLVAGYLYYQPDWSDHGRKATSSNVRYYIWSTSIEIIKKNPIWGVGLSNYQNYFTQFTKDRVNYPEFISPQALTAHNIFLQFYLTTGLFGLISVLALAIASLYRARSPQYVALLIAILSYGLVDTPFFRNDLAVLFWIALALLYENRD